MAIWEDYEVKDAVPMKAVLSFPEKEGFWSAKTRLGAWRQSRTA